MNRSLDQKIAEVGNGSIAPSTDRSQRRRGTTAFVRSSDLDLDLEAVQQPPPLAVVVLQDLQPLELLRVGEQVAVVRDGRLDPLHGDPVRSAGADGVGEFGGRLALQPELDEFVGEVGPVP
jgi:hypothetical protein